MPSQTRLLTRGAVWEKVNNPENRALRDRAAATHLLPNVKQHIDRLFLDRTGHLGPQPTPKAPRAKDVAVEIYDHDLGLVVQLVRCNSYQSARVYSVHPQLLPTRTEAQI